MPGLTCQVVVLLALVVRQGHELSEQQRVLEHSLHGLDEVGLQGGRVLLGGIPGIQESLEGLVGLCCKQVEKSGLEESSGPSSFLLGWSSDGEPELP